MAKSKSTAIAKAAPKANIMVTMSKKLGMTETQMTTALKATVFRVKGGDPPATEGECFALMVVANEHGLNPFKKEIYAFRGQNGGIVPIVPIDGWTNIINSHPQFDGMTMIDVFDAKDQFVGVRTTIHRKDRKVATESTEWLSECFKATGPWKSHPRRMTRWKSVIQCARAAFSLSGIHDEDEAETIRDAMDAEVLPNESKVESVRGAIAMTPEADAGTGGDKFVQAPEAMAEAAGNGTFSKDDNPAPIDEPEKQVEPEPEPPAEDSGEALAKVTRSRISGHCGGLKIGKEILLAMIEEDLGIVVEALDDLTEEQGQDVVEHLVMLKAKAKDASS